MKVDIFIYSWIFSHLLLIVRSGQTVQNTLKCYQCEIEGKDPHHTCKDEDLKVCPNDYAADRCLTNIKRNVTGHYHISKRCALAPCELPGIQSSLLKLTSSCDQSRDEFSCYTCCDSDGCNFHSSARGIHQVKASWRMTFMFITSLPASIFLPFGILIIK
ncbi:unnamed protein product [Orchesella dallaii]|uniref:Uncharacterized protein n=1 Tax=Orchesella dallaii TaxID=48710 RepID=A0ABP1QFX0_9HEXA